MTLASLPRIRAERAPAAACLRDDALELDNTAFLDRVSRAASALSASGLSPGDVLALKMGNRCELIILLFAAWRIGAIVTPINPALGPDETRYQIEDSAAVLTITEAEPAPSGPTRTVDEMLGPAASAPGQERRSEPDDLAMLIYTSGTTGNPKGVMLTHGNIAAMVDSFISWFHLGPGDHSLLVLPLFHANGIVLGTLSALTAGGQVSITGRFSRDRFFADVERLRPTYFSAVPAIYALLHSLPEDVRPDTSSLRFAVCGAAPMPAELITRFEERFGVTIVEGYGLSETTTASAINPLDGVRKPGTVGLPLPGQKIALIDEDGGFVDDEGEIVISGPVIMAGYLNRPEATAETIVNGWLRTGDVGRFDSDGYLMIVDRVKDMIIRGGENIYPKEIENVLYRDPGVYEAAVIGGPDEILGEVPVAYVSLNDGAETTPEGLIGLAAEHLASFKVPVAVHLIEAIPKNAVGKIDKPSLRRLG